jgi:hypothetical protein
MRLARTDRRTPARRLCASSNVARPRPCTETAEGRPAPLLPVTPPRWGYASHRDVKPLAARGCIGRAVTADLSVASASILGWGPSPRGVRRALSATAQLRVCVKLDRHGLEVLSSIDRTERWCETLLATDAPGAHARAVIEGLSAELASGLDGVCECLLRGHAGSTRRKLGSPGADVHCSADLPRNVSLLSRAQN